jgi:hypothetical protein
MKVVGPVVLTAAVEALRGELTHAPTPVPAQN